MEDEIITIQPIIKPLIHMLTEDDVVTSLSSRGVSAEFAVPNVSVVQDLSTSLTNLISSVSSNLSTMISSEISSLSASYEIGTHKLISSITQTNGKVTIGTRDFQVEDISSVAIISNDFRNVGHPRIEFKYTNLNDGGHVLYLGILGTPDEEKLSIDCNDFIKDGMISSVINGTDTEGPYIEFIWNADTDPSSRTTRIHVKDILGGVYKGVSPISVDDNLSISLNIEALKGILEYDNLKNSTAYISDWIDSNFYHFDDKDLNLLETKKGISAQYIYTNNLSASNLSAEVTSLVSVDSTPVSQIITAIGETSGIIQISSAILDTTMISGLRQELDKLTTLSNQISTKVFIKNYDISDNPISCYDNLSVIKLTDSEYNELVYTGEIYKLSNVIFVVSSDIIDAHQMQIRNVADGTAPDDAVTLKQLNDVSSSSHGDFTSALTSTVDSLSVEQITLSSLDAPISVIASIGEVSGKVTLTGMPLVESMVQNLETDLATLSNQISTKVFIKNYDDNDNPVSCYDNISVIKLPDSEYEELVLKDELSGLSNVIFVLSSDFVNAYGMQIKNLADGTRPDDAVTLKQLNDVSSSSHGDFTSALTSTVDSLSVEQITLSSSDNTISVITAIDEISGKISISASTLTQSMVQNLTTDLGNISNEVSTKIFVENFDQNDNPISEYTNLSVVKVTDAEYNELIYTGEIYKLSNVIFVVSSDIIDAHQMQIRNVEDGTDPNDAVNLRQLTAISSQLSTGMVDISAEISTKVYVQNQMLSDYVGTLSILQIPRDEFYALLPDGVQPNALYLISSDTINAYGQRMENLGNAVHDTDAINKGQAIEIIENAFTNMSRDWVCGQISATLGDYEDLENVDWEHITIETVIDMVKFIYSKMGAGKVQY